MVLEAVCSWMGSRPVPALGCVYEGWVAGPGALGTPSISQAGGGVPVAPGVWPGGQLMLSGGHSACSFAATGKDTVTHTPCSKT